MNQIRKDCKKMINEYIYHIKYGEVMNELIDCSELEVIKYPNCNDYFNTEFMHFNLPSGKLSVRTQAWTMGFEIGDNPCNSDKIINNIKTYNQGCRQQIAIEFKYRLTDTRYLHF